MTSSEDSSQSIDQVNELNEQQLEQKQPIWNFQNLSNFSNTFQLKYQLYILGKLIDHNNSLFIDLLKKYENLESIIAKVKHKYYEYKIKQQKYNQIKKKKMQQASNINALNLEIQLFGCKEYEYQLQLDKPIEKELYKQRNFDIFVKIVDKYNNVIINNNSIPITLVAYNSEQTPSAIFQNKVGVPIFKGNCERELYRGAAEFTKLQFRQVSSIYSQKWIYFVIFTKPSSFKIQNKEQLSEYIQNWQIKPLILSQIIVKSKKK